MPNMTPFPEDAPAYILFEARTGSNVGSAASRPELRELLDEILDMSKEDFAYVSVVALDAKGQRMGAWSALEVLADA